MRVKLDENLPERLVASLTELGHDVDTAVLEGLDGGDDAAIWDAAQQAHRFLVTQDLDFADARRFTPGTHNGLLLVRLRNPGRDALFEKVRSLFSSEDVTSWKGCLVVTSERKLRVRR